MSKPVLQIENLNKTYMLGKREVPALKNLNLTVNARRIRGDHGTLRLRKNHPAKHYWLQSTNPLTGKCSLDGIDVGKMPENQLYKITPRQNGFRIPNLQPAALPKRSRKR